MRIIGIILTVLFLYISPISAFTLSLDTDTNKLCDTIIKSFYEETDNWIITNNRLVYSSDLNTVKALRSHMWPEVVDGAILILIFAIHHFEYVQLDKPFEVDFDGEEEENLLREIKILIYKKLKKEVGHLVDKKKEVKTKPKEIPIKVEDPNKLKRLF